MKIKHLIVSAVVLTACSSAETVETTTTTLPPPKPVVLVSVGDISCSGSQRNSGNYDCADPQVAEIARQQNPDYVLALGDIQYNSHQVNNFENNFAVYWADMLDIVKPVPGNHEYAMGGARDYYAIWTEYPAPGYHSFSLNDDWHVIGINTNDNCSDVDCREGSEQYLWVQAELEQNKHKCVIVMGHHPRYSSGHHGPSPVLSDIYELFHRYGVIVYLSGHDHHYERINSPVPNIVVGTGGKSLRSLGEPYSDGFAASVFATADHHGLLRTEIVGKTMSNQFMTIDGLVLDQHQYSCSK